MSPAATERPRSLADDLRARDDAALAALLRARPDLRTPVPADLAALAARATTRPSVQRALDAPRRVHPAGRRRARAPCRTAAPQTTYAGCLAPTPPRRSTCCDRRPWSTAPTRADVVRARCARSSATRPGSARRPSRRCAATGRPGWPGCCRPRAGRAGRPGERRAPRRRASSATATGSTRCWPTPAPPGATEAARRPHLGAADRPAGAGRPRARPGAPRPRPVEWLLARGLLVALRRRRPWCCPARSALRAARRPGAPRAGADRAGRWRPPPVDVDHTDQTAGGAAAETPYAWSRSCSSCGRPTRRRCCAPAGSGCATGRAPPAALDVDEDTLALLLETAHAAGLLAVGGDVDEVWLPTPTYDGWRDEPSPHRWAALAEAWLDHPGRRAGGQPGQPRPGAGPARARPDALGRARRTAARAADLASLPRGRGHDGRVGVRPAALARAPAGRPAARATWSAGRSGGGAARRRVGRRAVGPRSAAGRRRRRPRGRRPCGALLPPSRSTTCCCRPTSPRSHPAR